MRDRAPTPARANLHLHIGEGWGAFTLVTAKAAGSADQSAFGQARWNVAAAVAVAQHEGPQLGPRAKLQKVSANAKRHNVA